MSFSQALVLAEVSATLFGLLSVYLLTIGDGRGWSLGVIWIVLTGVVFASQGLFGSTLLQVAFLLFQGLGWWRWSQGAEKDLRVASRGLGRRKLAGLILFWAGCWLLTLQALSAVEGSQPLADSFCTIGSLLAQTLMVYGYRECWVVWLLVDLVYVVVCGISGLIVFAVLYLLFSLLAIHGWREWTRDRPPGKRMDKAHGHSPEI